MQQTLAEGGMEPLRPLPRTQPLGKWPVSSAVITADHLIRSDPQGFLFYRLRRMPFLTRPSPLVRAWEGCASVVAGEHTKVQCLAQGHFVTLNAGSGIKPPTFKSVDRRSASWATAAPEIYLKLNNKYSTYFLFPNRRVRHSQWIQFSVCRLYLTESYM